MKERRGDERRSMMDRREDEKDRRLKDDTQYNGIDRRGSMPDRRVRMRRLHHRREGWMSV